MKKLWILMFAVLLISVAAAEMEFDNVGDYDAQTKTMTIIDNFGLGGTLAEITLTSPLNVQVIRGADRLVAEFTIVNYGDYDEVFNALEFYNMKANGKGFTRGFQYKYKDYKDVSVNDYETVCDDVLTLPNGTGFPTNCHKVEIGNHIEVRGIWKPLNHKAILPVGIVNVGIFVDVQPNEQVEWIPTFYGVEITEWASWTESLNVDIRTFWKLNESTGTLIDAVGNMNLPPKSTPVYNQTGIIGTSVGSNSAEDVFQNSTRSTNAANTIFGTTGNFSVSFWINTTEDGNNQDVAFSSNASLGTGFDDCSYGFAMFNDGTPKGAFVIRDGCGGAAAGGFIAVTGAFDGDWHNILFTRSNSGTNWSLYLDGSLHNTTTFAVRNASGFNFTLAGDQKNNRPWNGLIDEFGIWGRTLSQAEATQLYNGGVGITWTDIFGVVAVNLNAPANDSDFQETTVEFNFTVTANTGNVDNATLFTWFPNGTLFGTNFTTLTGVSNSSNLSLSGFLPAGGYIWNVFGCASNATPTTECEFATNNRTFNIIPFTENSQTFTPFTTEGSTEEFEINITILGGLQVETAILWYNGTTNTGTIDSQANDVIIITRQLEIPDVAATGNATFFWEIGLDAGSPINSTSNNQSVTALNIDNCSSFSVLILNYTLRDEAAQTFINAATQNSTIELDVQISTLLGTQILNFSQSYSEINPAQVCLDVYPTQYRLDSEARYLADDYVTEFHHIQNLTLENATIPQNINLFVLLATQSTEFLITFKDQSFLPVEDALIDITRKYVAEGVFKSIEIPLTDQNGQAIGHFDLDNVRYTIIISKDGEILATFANVAVVCEDETIGDCKLNLNALATGVAFSNFNETGGIFWVMSFNRSSRTVTTIFSTVGGGVKTVQLNGTKMDRFGNTTLCTDSLTTSSGTLTCTVPGSAGNLTVIAELFSDGEHVTTQYYTIQISARDVFGGTGYFLLFFLILTIPMLFATSTIGVIIGVVFGLIFAILLNLYSGGSIIGQSSAVIWAIVAGGIIIWKIMTRE